MAVPGRRGWDIAGLAVVVAISVIAFRWLVRLSVKYMALPNPPPLLPKPLTQSGQAGRGYWGRLMMAAASLR